MLSVFTAANAYHITAEDVDLTDTSLNESVTEPNEAQNMARADRIADVRGDIAAAAVAAGNTQADPPSDIIITTNWDPDTPDMENTEDVDEFEDGVLQLLVDIDGGGGVLPIITSATMEITDDDGVVTTHDNAMTIDGVSGFKYGFDMFPIDTDSNNDVTDGTRVILGTRVLAFTDREQEVAAVPAVSEKVVQNQPVMGSEIESLTPAGGDTYTGEYDEDGMPDTAPIEGTFTCDDDATTACRLTYTITDGVLQVDTATNYLFSGRREGAEGKAADENLDYLVFGIWLNEAEGGTEQDPLPDVVTFGAFANGEEPYATTVGNIDKTLKGKANYSGEAVGAHAKTADPVSFFSGDANLTADFGDDTAGDTAGNISGSISNIRVNGGAAMSQSIHLVKADFADGVIVFSGAAVMGAQSTPGSATHDFGGTWSGGFYNNTDDNEKTSAVNEALTTPPGAVAGTFGVTRFLDMDNTDPKDDVTESFVGAFGAHRE